MPILVVLVASWSGCGVAPARTGGVVALGVNIERAPDDPRVLDRYSALVGARPSVVMWYQTWSEPLFYRNQILAVAKRHELPLITWEPFINQRGIALKDIGAGKYDRYLRASARSAKRARIPIFVRFGHEMNLPKSPWGSDNGNTPADFIAAWRRVVKTFRRARAVNVRFVWCPNVDAGRAPFTALYPGDQWVDWVALDGYNRGSFADTGWRSLESVFLPSYTVLTKLTRKPMLIGETGAPENGGDKADWITQGLLSDVPASLPRVRAIVWFNRLKNDINYRIDSSPGTLAAFRRVATSPLYRGRLIR